MTQPNPKLLREVQAIPRAIEPAFQLSLDSNAAVVLWNGTLDITQGSVTEQGSAEIRWVWLPYPRVEFTCTLTGFSQISVRQPIHVNSPESFVDSDGLIFNKLYDGANTLLTGSLKQVQYGRDQELQSVVFHLPNFYPYLGDGIRDDIAIRPLA